ncbi:hypothetical protein [Paenibacillus terrigena]|uniref:hypothetical protein n=1 Tax=Paenibacillus terrigena TaxID=369333 RepID=UPI00036F3DD4|nr:hypothetical protein [Paenibacillus terrigena]
MDLTQLNSLAARYKVSGDEAHLRLLYDEAAPIKRSNRLKVTMSSYGDAADADELFDDAIMELLQRNDIINFGKMLIAALNLKRLHLFRTIKRRNNNIKIEGSLDDTYIDEQGSPNPKIVLKSSHIVEDEVIKKETDQRQLIDFLLDRANDPVTTLIVTKFKNDDCSTKSMTALAKALGLHHETAMRKLRSLVKHYDANRFGDYYEYLAV